MSNMPITITDEAVTVAGVTIPHNERPWRSATNRHTNTDGTSWGWIDGATGHVCWSDNERFNRAAASAAVTAHNKWLEDCQPLPIKIIKAKQQYEQALTTFNAINSKHSHALADMNKARLVLAALREQRKSEAA
ncbi:hypothetical protein [Bordetella genomosp. 11]|uniref:Uncharacterized protein n=1 Tax=Bordetella genomosp. 11 TaxID=1416808 RepID=A0A261UEG8_9BORD|nr:hypothetical protein [Bordetella genomosp. 11]OZI59907.1 hypothetical protein CAL28_10480 [Bordetella genomosp. 11]